MTTVVDVWLAEHPLPGHLDPIKKLAAAFEAAHPGHRIEVTGVGFRELPAEVARAAERGRPPDLAEFYATATRTALDLRAPSGAPLFVPVERAVAGRGEILGERVVLAGLEPAVRGYYTYQGELVAAPLTATTAVLLGNAAMLEAAGVTAMPRTWAELESACAATGSPATWANHGWLAQQAVAGQGGLLADHDNGRSARAQKVELASPELLAYATWWQGLHERGHYLDTGTPEDWGGTLRAFAEQRAAFTIASSVVVGMLARDCPFEVAAAPLPHNERAPRAGHLISGQAFWLAAGLPREKEDTALAFLQHLLDARNVAAWHRGTGFLPVTTASVELLEREGWYDRHPIHRAATGQLRAADGSPAALGAVAGDLAGIQDRMTGALADVLRGAEPAARLAGATAEAQRLLDAYNDDCARGRSPRALAVK